MTIHKEGKATILLTAIFVIILNFVASYYFSNYPKVKIAIVVFSILFCILILQFFRKPRRKITINDNYVLAPADGKVVVIEKTIEDEYFKDSRIQVSIFMSPINVHMNFMPVSGIISYFKYHPGKFLFAWHPKSSTENERTSIAVKNSLTEILMRQIAGALARRICYYVKENDIVTQGEEFGFIKFGSRVDLFLPLNAKIKVNLEDKTVGGQTIIAELT